MSCLVSDTFDVPVLLSMFDLPSENTKNHI